MILESILITILIGFPVSFYAGLVCARILIFHNLKEEALFLFNDIGDSVEPIAICKEIVGLMESIRKISSKLHRQGHEHVATVFFGLTLAADKIMKNYSTDKKSTMTTDQLIARGNQYANELDYLCKIIQNSKPDLKAIIKPWL